MRHEVLDAKGRIQPGACKLTMFACGLLVQRWDAQKLGGKPQEEGALHRRYKYEHSAGHSGGSESVVGER